MDNILDDFAQTNALRDVDTRLKLILGVGCILISVFSETPYTPLFIAISLGVCCIFIAKIPARLYFKLLAIPASFAAMSCIVILFLTGGGDLICSFPVLGYPLLVTTDSINLALLLIGRTLGGMSALYFIALTTPMIDLFSVMQSLRVPKEFIDLSMLIYRCIFILIGEMIEIHNAQEMRHGHSSFRNSIRSFFMMVGMLFIRTCERGDALVLAMDSRCYDGKLGIIEEKGTLPVMGVASVVLFLSSCIILTILTRNMQII